MEFPWTAPDGLSFTAQRWLPSAAPRAVLLCVHGLGGAATDFLNLSKAATDNGLAVFGLNLRGQGLHPIRRDRGTALDLAALEEDLVAFADLTRAEFPDLPVFWIGESMGALVLSHLLAARPSLPLAGAIFSVPVVELRNPTPKPVRRLLNLLARVLPRFRLHPGLFVSGKSEPLPITRDKDHVALIRASEHYIPAFTIGFLDSLAALMDRNRDIAARLHQPCLVLAAGHDVYIHPDQVESWFHSIDSADKTFKVYPDAYHLLWNDWDRDIVLADILAWLDAKLSPR